MLTVDSSQTLFGQPAELPTSGPGMIGRIGGVTAVEDTAGVAAIARFPLVGGAFDPTWLMNIDKQNRVGNCSAGVAENQPSDGAIRAAHKRAGIDRCRPMTGGRSCGEPDAVVGHMTSLGRLRNPTELARCVRNRDQQRSRRCVGPNPLAPTIQVGTTYPACSGTMEARCPRASRSALYGHPSSAAAASSAGSEVASRWPSDTAVARAMQSASDSGRRVR